MREGEGTAPPRRRETEVFADIVRSISAARELSVILQRVADGARELCHADLSAIALHEEESGEMVFRYRAGERRTRSGARLVVVCGRGAGGRVLESGQAFRSDDLPHDPRVAGDPGYLAAVAAERIVCVLCVPIRGPERIEGLLYVDNRAPRPFTAADEAMLALLADHAAIAIRNAALLDQEQRARTVAEAANRLKDEFLATVSHELRTPLNAILGWTIMLRNPQFPRARVDGVLEVIERNARTLGHLIEDLLDVSRIVTGKLQLSLQPVDLAEVADAALDAARPAAGTKPVTLEAALPRAQGFVAGDADRLQQVIGNLLSNAIKFTPAGGAVRVRLARADGNVELAVTDTGAGIEPAELPRIFDRFHQADRSTSRRQGGLGIGLALARHIVEGHGGWIAAHSDGPGRGATFTVTLPVIEASATGHTREFSGGRAGRSGLLDGVRVLIAEDQPDTLALFVTVLTAAGAEVRPTRSAAEALDVFRGWRPDVVISDIEMPGEDGFALLEKLRGLVDGDTGLAAVAVTAYGRPEDRRRILSAGFRSHLVKPIDPAELITTIAAAARR